MRTTTIRTMCHPHYRTRRTLHRWFQRHHHSHGHHLHLRPHLCVACLRLLCLPAPLRRLRQTTSQRAATPASRTATEGGEAVLMTHRIPLLSFRQRARWPLRRNRSSNLRIQQLIAAIALPIERVAMGSVAVSIKMHRDQHLCVETSQPPARAVTAAVTLLVQVQVPVLEQVAVEESLPRCLLG